jgi:hypothetical protein
VTITGTNLTGATAVKFGSVNATRFRVRSPISIAAVTPPGAETVFVTVTTPGGTSAPTTTDQFTYATPGEWTLFPSPNAGSLTAASCLSSDFCVAVGTKNETLGRENETLMESWNGTEWSVVPAPTPPESAIELGAVSCSTRRFCMAVGAFHPVLPRFHGPGPAGYTGLAEAWNGSKWSVVPTPGVAYLEGVSCVSAKFCLAAGEADGGASLMELWNGSAWSITPIPTVSHLGHTSYLSHVSCASMRFCMAVGGDWFQPVAASWNGTEWATVLSPTTRTGEAALNDISCASAKRCVAVGKEFRRSLVESWNGSTWSIVETPNPEGPGYPELNAVSCVSAKSCVAVGADDHEEGLSKTLVETSKGGKWSIVPSANTASGRTYLDAVACISIESCFAFGSDTYLAEGPGQYPVLHGGIF